MVRTLVLHTRSRWFKSIYGYYAAPGKGLGMQWSDDYGKISQLTYAKIGKEAGLHTTTVKNVLKGYRPTSDVTKAKVYKAIEKLRGKQI